MKTKECFRLDSIIPQWPIVLSQQGKDNFTIAYGKQVDKHLTYSKACSKLGEAIMHALACEGKLDNDE